MLLHVFGTGTLVTLVCSILLLGSSFHHSPVFSLEILVFGPRFFLFGVIFFHLFRLSLQLLFRITFVSNLVKELLAVSKIDSGTTSSFEKLRNYQRFRKLKQLVSNLAQELQYYWFQKLRAFIRAEGWQFGW
jgi:hypothetical protein